MGRRRGGGKEEGPGAGRKGSKDWPWTLVGLCVKCCHDRKKRMAEVSRARIQYMMRRWGVEVHVKSYLSPIRACMAATIIPRSAASAALVHVHFSFCLVTSKDQEVSKSFSLVLVGLLRRPPSARALFRSFSVLHAT